MAQHIYKKETTAVESLKKILEDFGDSTHLRISWVILDKLCEQALAMEKEQIEMAYLNGCFRVTPYGYYNDSAEQYYNETYDK